VIISSPTFGGTGCLGNGPTNSHVVAEYIFQEGGGTTTINSGTDSEAGDATLVNGAAFSTDVPPANNNCGWSVNLPSQGSGATTPAVETDANYDPLSGATSFTIMAWVKRESAASNNNTSARIVSDTSALTSGSGFEFRFSGSAGTLALRINGNELSTTVGGIAPNSNTWHHVAVVYDGTRPATNALTRHAHFYVDGIQRGLGVSNATLNVTVAANTNKLTIGNSAVSRGVGNLLVGKIDDVRILRGFAPDAVGDGKTNDVILCYLNRADDFEPPTIICPPDVTVQADPGQSYATNVPLGGPQVADNCGMVSVANDAPAQFPIGVIGVTWTATDAAGNRSSCVQAVTVESSSPPTTDSDGDGLTDWEEINIYGTDPNNPDTDGDRMNDGWEVAHGLNPLLNDANADADNDGATNLEEYWLATDPHVAEDDHDGDGLSTALEKQLGTRPFDPDTDGDGMSDGWEVERGFNPKGPDTGDKAPDADPDGDGFSNRQEAAAGTNPFSSSSKPPEGVWVKISWCDDGCGAKIALKHNGKPYGITEGKGCISKEEWWRAGTTHELVLTLTNKQKSPYSLTVTALKTTGGCFLADPNNPPSSGTIAPLGASRGPFKFYVAKVEVKKVWSNQLPDRESNFLPDGSGTANYILVGARQEDGAVHVKARVKITPDMPQTVQSKILFRMGIQSSGSPQPRGVGSLDGDIASMAVLDTDDYYVLAGCDEDGDAQLSPSEVKFVSPYKIKAVGTGQYTFAKDVLWGYVQGQWVGFIAASGNLRAFLENAKPPLATGSMSTAIARDDPDLNHPVGLYFNNSCVDDIDAKEYSFNPFTEVADKVLNSKALSNILVQVFNQHSDEVRRVFDKNQDIQVTNFPWEVSNRLMSYSRDDPGSDLEWAFGDVYLESTSVDVRVQRQGLMVLYVRVVGQTYDLYDFNFDFPRFEDHRGAEVQAGYPTLGVAGHVYRNRVFINDVRDMEFNF
jgi:hypothetical protein